jgi:hypothetical protein
MVSAVWMKKGEWKLSKNCCNNWRGKRVEGLGLYFTIEELMWMNETV